MGNSEELRNWGKNAYKTAALTLASEQIGAGVGTIDILSKAHAK
jgi:hypothetical protein